MTIKKHRSDSPIKKVIPSETVCTAALLKSSSIVKASAYLTLHNSKVILFIL